MRLKELARPEDFVSLPCLNLTDVRLCWCFGHSGYTGTCLGTYLGTPVFLERVRRNAVLSEPSRHEHRFLVVALTDEQFEQAAQLHEGEQAADKAFYRAIDADGGRYGDTARCRRSQASGLANGKEHRQSIS